MKILRKLVITLAIVACIATLATGVIISYENMRQFAYDDNEPAIYTYENKSGDKVLKLFDSKINLSQLTTSTLMSMRGLTDYLSKHLDTFLDKVRRTTEYLKLSFASIIKNYGA